jgi:large subunit ribosomal protein L30
MATIKIKLVRSAINRPLTQKRTLEALGLKKLNQVVEHEDNASTRGQVAKVLHLIQVQEN